MLVGCLLRSDQMLGSYMETRSRKTLFDGQPGFELPPRAALTVRMIFVWCTRTAFVLVLLPDLLKKYVDQNAQGCTSARVWIQSRDCLICNESSPSRVREWYESVPWELSTLLGIGEVRASWCELARGPLQFQKVLSIAISVFQAKADDPDIPPTTWKRLPTYSFCWTVDAGASTT
eukprot:2032416-Amphidinium_carterae.1